MTAKEWLEVITKAEDYNPSMTPLILKYGELLLLEAKEEEAVDFAEWIGDNAEYFIEKGKWRLMYGYRRKQITTAELYKEYLTQKSSND